MKTERDLYIAVKRAKAEALRNAAEMIAHDYQRNGHPVRSSIESAANACEDHAKWAEGKTAKEFRSERWKP